MPKPIVIAVFLLSLILTPALFAQGGCGGACAGSGCGGSCGGNAEPVESSQAVFSTGTLAALVRANTPLVLIDCRSGSLPAGEKIPGAKPLTASCTAEQAAALIPTKGALIVTYDRSRDVPLRHGVIDTLRALGYTNIVDYPGGLPAWKAASNSVELEQPEK